MLISKEDNRIPYRPSGLSESTGRYLLIGVKQLYGRPCGAKGGEMDYLYINEKGKYERLENRKELKKTIFFLLGLSLVCLSMGILYLMTSYF